MKYLFNGNKGEELVWVQINIVVPLFCSIIETVIWRLENITIYKMRVNMVYKVNDYGC
jgi:hypothetical protein